MIDEKKLVPGEIGFVVSDLLAEHFPNIFDVGFTSQLEDELDEIATGERAWVPTLREFYELSAAMLRASPVDVPAYEQRSYEIFRALAASLGWPPEGLVDHLKNIPRELVGIAKVDPTVLDSFENFLVALRGPP